MEARMNLFGSEVSTKVLKYLTSAHYAVAKSSLPESIQELVRLRASQINGCGFCVDMHTKEALHAGETPVRLALVAAWRETTVFTEAERAALELAEEGTRVADASGGVPNEVWANAAKHFDEDQLAALISTIAIINAFNRMNIIAQLPTAGDYEPGQALI